MLTAASCPGEGLGENALHLLAAGLDVYDEATGLHVLWSTNSTDAAHLAESLALK